MCGFAGIVASGLSKKSGHQVRAALACLRHRGPEPPIAWMSPQGQCVLGHGRLSIIDPGPEAAQPFHLAERYSLVYNGELYNYVELRQELQRRGMSFRTRSDTEVLLAAWTVWGAACLDRFDGMFAFGLWDDSEQCFYAARDRFGEKPFFFHFGHDRLLFASELKGLWPLGLQPSVNQRMAYNFLTLGYTGNPADPKETFYEDVLQLPPAHFLRYRPGEETLSMESYGRIEAGSETPADAGVIAQFRTLLGTSVRRRLRSDVPVGTSLSGGIDSASVAAFCQEQGGSTYTHRAFTAIFPGFEKDEQQQAALVARHLRLQQTFVEIRDDEVVPLMERVMRYQDEPVASGSALAQFRVFEAARAAGVTVLLDGQGADEVLAGYDKYYRWYWQELYRSRQLGSSGELEAARALGVPDSFGWAQRVAALFPDFAASLLEGRRARQAAGQSDLNTEWVRAQRPHFYYLLPSAFTLNAVLHYNTFDNGLPELLRLADRNSMAHSVEVRLPFLSTELVRFVFSLAPSYKIRQGRTKWLLRKAVEDLLPGEVVWATRKTGFEPPQLRWMQLPEVQDAIRAGKERLVAAGVLDPRVLNQKIKPHTAYAASAHDWKYWTLSYLY